MLGLLELPLGAEDGRGPDAARLGLIEQVVGSAVAPLASRTDNPNVTFCCHHLPVLWVIGILPITFEQMSSPSHVKYISVTVALAKTKALCFLRCEELSLGTVGAEIGTRGTWLSPPIPFLLSRKRNPTQGICQDLLVLYPQNPIIL